MGIMGKLTAQAANPHGPLGVVTAAIMPVLSDAQCGDLGGMLDLRPEDDLLDVACGSGVFLQRYGSRVRHVAGIDQSAIQIRMARRRNRDLLAAGRAEIVHGDATRMPWPDGHFDAVACNCLGCFTQPRAAMEEMLRVLRGGGRAAFSTEYCPDPTTAREQQQRVGLPYWTETQFRELIEDVGFTGIRTSHVGNLVFYRADKP